MKYDLELIAELCNELELRTVPRTSERVAIELEEGIVLVFINAEEDEHSRVGFEDVGWHYHEDLACCDRHGFYTEIGYMDVLIGLTDGTILICEHWRDGALKERSLVHREFVDEFRYLQVDEEVRLRRVRARKPRAVE